MEKYKDKGLTGLGNEAVTITGAATAADITTINTNTTGIVTVNSTAITGTYAQLITLYAANGNSVAGLGNEAITVIGGITVAQANSLDALTTGVVTATISDTDSATLSGLLGTNAYTITIAETSISATNL